MKENVFIVPEGTKVITHGIVPQDVTKVVIPDTVIEIGDPRASLAVVSMAKAAAWVQGRDYVIPNDVKLIYPATVTHRLILTAEAKASGITPQSIISDILDKTAAPAARS